MTLLAGLAPTHAQILVGPTGSPTYTFDTRPPATEWSTVSVGTSATAFNTFDALDAEVPNTTASSVATQVGESGTIDPAPSANALARRNTAGNFLQIRPTGNSYTLLMATLQNDTGAAATYLNVTYDFAQRNPNALAEDVPGWRAFWSLTGEPGSWTLIPEFSGVGPGSLAVNLEVGTWAIGAKAYILWADENAGGEEGAYTLDNFRAAASTGREPVVSTFYGNGTQFTAVLTDGLAPRTVNTSSVTATVNGTTVPTTANVAGETVTIRGDIATALAANTTNTAVITFTDGNTPAKTYTITRTFVVGPFQVIPASFAVTGVNTSSNGFRALMYQLPAARTALPGSPGGSFDVNFISSAERQLINDYTDPGTGETLVNQATPNAESPDGAYFFDVINWNQAAPTPPAAETGNFHQGSTPPNEDVLIPGVTTYDNIVSEILTYVELKAGRAYRMGVNSDDGFKVTVGPNPRDLSSMVLGSFSGGRGAADTLVDFMAEADGIYPMRLLWWEGGGGANVEWFMVDDLGRKVLLNDRSVATHVKTYSTGPAAAPYLKAISPGTGITNASGALIIKAVIADGSTTVQPSGVKLFVNNVEVTSSATIAKVAGSAETTISYDPPGTLAPMTILNGRLVYTDSASVSRTNDFIIQVHPQILVDVNETQIWKYNDTGDDLGTGWRERLFDDSVWNAEVVPATGGQGPALLGFETTSVEPMRTLIRRNRESDGTQPITYYFRTHFTFDGNPATVNLFLRHVIDDGAVFYLNGQELTRFGTAAATVVNYLTLFTGHENAWVGPVAVPRSALINGDNVLAVEVHQSDAGSSDLVMGMQLFYVPDPNAVPGRVASFTPATNAVNQATNATLSFLLEEGTTSFPTANIKLTVNGAVVTPIIDKPAGGILTTVSYTPPGNGYTPESVVSGTLEVTDSAGTKTTVPFSFQITPTLEPIFLVDETGTTLPTQEWRYLNTGEDAGTAWREKTFDDSAWGLGAPLFGAAETGATVAPQRTPDLSRVGSDGVTRITTDYFRTKTTIADANTRLAIRHAVDDGLVMYINGQEVYRFGFDPALTTITYTNVTITDHENRWEGPFIIPNTGLVSGENVIAVEVHQNAASSSDMVFGLELYKITSTAPQPTESRFQTTTFVNGQVRIAWTGPGRLQENTDITNRNGWTDVPNATNPYLTPPTGTLKFFRVIQ